MATIVETNVASEIGEPRAHPAVLDWWDRQPIEEMFTTAVTEADCGVELINPWSSEGTA